MAPQYVMVLSLCAFHGGGTVADWRLFLASSSVVFHTLVFATSCRQYTTVRLHEHTTQHTTHDTQHNHDMPLVKTLRGGCQCGRNHYIVQPPPDAAESVQLLFDPAPAHRISLASPLPTYLRVPLAWYHSQTVPFFDDETPATISRTYEHPHRASTRRNFCGYCGTPLSFWAESPHPERDYIRLALGSLHTEDLEQLDDWAELAGQPDTSSSSQALAGATGIPWFDAIVEGSSLGRHLAHQRAANASLADAAPKGATIQRHEAGASQSTDGRTRVEWEVVEWTEGDADGDSGSASPAKRARVDGGAASTMAGSGKSTPMDAE